MKSIIIHKKMAHKRFKKTNSRIDYQKFNDLRRLVKSESKLSYSNYLIRTQNNLTSNSNF